jgi:cytidylate kinase
MTHRNGLIIAIDGHSSCGKSTIAKALAARLQYTFIDTGAMYRGVTWYALKHGWVSDAKLELENIEQSLGEISMEFRFNPANNHNDLFINDTNVEKSIRSPEVAQSVSRIAAIKKVRAKLVDWQREMAGKGGIVMDGRDIGTVVFPHADLKLFITADLDERARRRYAELCKNKVECTFEEVKKNLLERDYLDSTRSESPLLKADDAIELDTTNMTIEQQLDRAIHLVHDLVDHK